MNDLIFIIGDKGGRKDKRLKTYKTYFQRKARIQDSKNKVHHFFRYLYKQIKKGRYSAGYTPKRTGFLLLKVGDTP